MSVSVVLAGADAPGRVAAAGTVAPYAAAAPATAAAAPAAGTYAAAAPGQSDAMATFFAARAGGKSAWRRGRPRGIDPQTGRAVVTRAREAAAACGARAVCSTGRGGRQRGPAQSSA